MRYLLSLLLFIVLSVPAPSALAATPLVDSQWVVENAPRPDVVILDVRNRLGGGSREAYLAGHIPGAIHSDYLADGWRTKVDGVVGQLPPIADLEALIGGLGIGNDSHVVVVAGGESALDMGSATRVYWTFKVLGHDQVSVLDGGYKAYAADLARPVKSGGESRSPTTFQADFQPQLLADRAMVAAALGSDQELIDMRPPPQYTGQTAHPLASRKGTIPGAVNLPESTVTRNGGQFLSEAELGALMTEIGAESGDEQISFCNTGHWASLGWFVSSELLGNENVRLYDGSMVEWTADESLPVERKAE